MRNWLKTVLFLSALSPSLVSIAVARMWDNGFTPDVGYYLASGLAGCGVAFLILTAISLHGEVIRFSAKKIEANDALMLGFCASYFVPFLTKASEITLSMVASIFVVGGLIFLLTSAIPAHPILRAFHYRFYKVESESGVVYTLISRRELVDPKHIQAVRRISSSMLMEVTQ